MWKDHSLPKALNASSPGTLRFGDKTRILIACDKPVLTGGFLRMERVAEHLIAWGHDVAYVAFGNGGCSDIVTRAPVLTFEACSEHRWHSVIVPGAGFPLSTIEAFRKLRKENFGTRIQMILNDTSLYGRFIEVNRAIQPHLVVFNNRHWKAGSFTELLADQFYFLEGAVDTAKFRPLPYRKHPSEPGTWKIGGLANKNPAPLLEALRLLPSTYRLRLFGIDVFELSKNAENLIAEGRLELTGPIFGEDLSRFYDDLDVVCMTEQRAGWANLVAEAMAAGLPVICTPHGTSAIAIDGVTAIVIENPSAERLAAEVQNLANNPSRCIALGRAARRKIEGYDWAEYARNLLAITFHDGRRDYYDAPELGLHGKWPISLRLSGLEVVIENCRNATVLDFGAAEGLVARAFLESGATLVHGIELDPSRAKFADQLVRTSSESFIRVGDISNWPALKTEYEDLRHQYDIVLYLGIHHHLCPSSRIQALRTAASCTRRFLACRMPHAIMSEDRLHEWLIEEGFKIVGDPVPPHSGAGETRIYERTRPCRPDLPSGS